MRKDTRHVGFDVDTEKVVVAKGEVRSLGAIRSRDESVRRLVKKLGPASRLKVCYEAGQHGYGLYWLPGGLGCTATWCPPSTGDSVRRGGPITKTGGAHLLASSGRRRGPASTGR
jgi:transposase